MKTIQHGVLGWNEDHTLKKMQDRILWSIRLGYLGAGGM